MSRGRRYLFILIVGLGGLAVLLSLGSWQVRRLAWKNDLIASLETRLAESPIALTGAETTGDHNFRRAVAEGAFRPTPQDAKTPARFLTSQTPYGPGFRAISAFELSNGVRVLVDRGFTPDQTAIPEPPEGPVALNGALHWPLEVGSFTPAPAIEEGRWFARDVPALAEALGTAPVMLVLSEPESAETWPQPVPVTVDLPNDHLGYAVTWFGLAAVWAAMSIALLLRRREPDTAV